MTDIDDLLSYRLLPRAARQSELDDLVRYHIEELNMLAERWSSRAGELDEGERLRAERLRTAAGWESAGFLAGVKRFIEEGRAEGEEAFGAAWLALVLGAETRAPFDRWWAGVPTPVIARVRQLFALTS